MEILETPEKVRLEYTPEELIEKSGINSPQLFSLHKEPGFYIEIYPQDKEINYCLPKIHSKDLIQLRKNQRTFSYDMNTFAILEDLAYELHLTIDGLSKRFSLTKELLQNILNKNRYIKYLSKKNINKLESIYDQYLDLELNKAIRENVPQTLLNSSLFALELAENPGYYKFRVYGLLDKYVNMFFNLQNPLNNFSRIEDQLAVQKKPSSTILKSMSMIDFKELEEIFSFDFQKCDETEELQFFSIQKLNLLLSQVKDVNYGKIHKVIDNNKKFSTVSTLVGLNIQDWIKFS